MNLQVGEEVLIHLLTVGHGVRVPAGNRAWDTYEWVGERNWVDVEGEGKVDDKCEVRKGAVGREWR